MAAGPCERGVIIYRLCPSEAPIPDKVHYIHPPDSLGAIGKFIGAWKGDWKGTVGHRLYVQEITGSTADVIISTGWVAREGYFDIDEGYQEMQGVVSGRDIMVTIKQDYMTMDITYTINDDDTVSAFGKFLVKGASRPEKLKTILHRDQDGYQVRGVRQLIRPYQ